MVGVIKFRVNQNRYFNSIIVLGEKYLKYKIYDRYKIYDIVTPKYILKVFLNLKS